MTDIMSKIADDLEEYQSLCKKYGEKVQTTQDRWGKSSPDCYGKHAQKLYDRMLAEQKNGTWTGWR